MELTDDQKRKVNEWLQEGAKLAEVQSRLNDEFGIKLTYMELRFLVDDLKLVPRDVDRPPSEQTGAESLGGNASGPSPSVPAGEQVAPGGAVQVSVDQITRPGALVSGKVTFSDGKKADWYLDQTGRLGLVPAEKGYRPAPVDVQQFQMALEKELSGLGL